jgi:hypothetical protein
MLEDLRHREGVAGCLDSLGFIHRQLGNYPEATSFGQRSVSHYRELGGQLNEAFTTAKLGDSFAQADDDAAADRAPAGAGGPGRPSAGPGTPALDLPASRPGGRPARPPGSGRRVPGYGRSSRMTLTGVWATSRNPLRPASRASWRTAAGPAWAPSATPPGWARAAGVHWNVDAA